MFWLWIPAAVALRLRAAPRFASPPSMSFARPFQAHAVVCDWTSGRFLKGARPNGTRCPEGPGAKAEVSSELERDARARAFTWANPPEERASLSTPPSRCRVCQPARLGQRDPVQNKRGVTWKTQLNLKIHLFIRIWSVIQRVHRRSAARDRSRFVRGFGAHHADPGVLKLRSKLCHSRQFEHLPVARKLSDPRILELKNRSRPQICFRPRHKARRICGGARTSGGAPRTVYLRRRLARSKSLTAGLKTRQNETWPRVRASRALALSSGPA